MDDISTEVEVSRGIKAIEEHLSKVRRYYETGVKSLLVEALIEYGFPIDAIRRIEENNSRMVDMDLLAAKNYCRTHYQAIKSLLDDYENQLFVRAMNSFK